MESMMIWWLIDLIYLHLVEYHSVTIHSQIQRLSHYQVIVLWRVFIRCSFLSWIVFRGFSKWKSNIQIHNHPFHHIWFYFWSSKELYSRLLVSSFWISFQELIDWLESYMFLIVLYFIIWEGFLLWLNCLLTSVVLCFYKNKESKYQSIIGNPKFQSFF